MSDPSEHDGADRVQHGEASLGEAQAENPALDPEMLNDVEEDEGAADEQ